MDKAYKYAKSAIVNFKLDTCCCFATIRIGLLIVGYFNLFIAGYGKLIALIGFYTASYRYPGPPALTALTTRKIVLNRSPVLSPPTFMEVLKSQLLSLIGTADGGITPPLMEVQDVLLEEEEVSMTAGIFAYACELAFSVVLLCAMYRSDIALLRVHIYFTMATVVTSVLIYSMVIAKVSLLTKITIISNIVFNCYVILLVRSAIVEIKERQSSEKNGHVVLYSVATVPHEDDRKVVEIKPIADTNEHGKDLKIEVISEASKKDDKISIEPVKNDKNGEESKKLDKIAKESVKNDKNDEESKKHDKVGEASTSSGKVDKTHAKLKTVKEDPKEVQPVGKLSV